jgi:ATP-dependent DNA ligase
MQKYIMKAGGSVFPTRSGLEEFPYWAEPLVVQHKMDGWFASAIRDPKGGKVRLFSATSRELKNPQLNRTVEALTEFLPPASIIVGELGFGTAAETAWAEKHGYHRFLPFDVVTLENKDIRSHTYRDRLRFLDAYFDKGVEPVQRVETHVLPSTMSKARKIDAVMTMYDRVKKTNGEGLMIKTQDHIYECPGVTSFVYKMKKIVTKDYVLLGFTKTTAKTYLQQGMTVAAMRLGLYINGKLTEVTNTSAFDFDMRKAFSQRPKDFIGQVVELGGYQVFASGAMRHPHFLRFRKDRRPKDCTLEN